MASLLQSLTSQMNKIGNVESPILKAPILNTPILNGGDNPVPLLYNNQGQANPVPRVNQESPIAKPNAIDELAKSPILNKPYVRPEAEGLSADNPIVQQYMSSKWLKPLPWVIAKAHEWERQKKLSDAKLANEQAQYITIDDQFISKLSDNDPIKPYLRPGMRLPVEQLYRFAALNQKQNQLDSDEVTDEYRNQLLSQYQDLDVTNPDDLAFRNAIINTIYGISSKKTLDREIARLNALRIPKEKSQVEKDKIIADTGLVTAKTVTEKERPALIRAQTGLTQAKTETEQVRPDLIRSQITKNNAQTNKIRTGGGGASSGQISKADKQWLDQINKSYDDYVASQKTKGEIAISKEAWIKRTQPYGEDAYRKYAALTTGNQAYLDKSRSIYGIQKGDNDEWSVKADRYLVSKKLGSLYNTILLAINERQDPRLVRALINRWNSNPKNRKISESEWIEIVQKGK